MACFQHLCVCIYKTFKSYYKLHDFIFLTDQFVNQMSLLFSKRKNELKCIHTVFQFIAHKYELYKCSSYFNNLSLYSDHTNICFYFTRKDSKKQEKIPEITCLRRLKS